MRLVQNSANVGNGLRSRIPTSPFASAARCAASIWRATLSFWCFVDTLKEESGFDVIGEAENGLKIPVLDGFEAARRIRQNLPEVAIVILSSEADRRLIDEAKKIGVKAFVPKTEAAIALVKAIEAAIRNDEFFVVE